LPLFEGKENCTFTIKVPRLYLEPSARRDITYRRAVWGTDVYTDDSDVLAACIHGGWLQGSFSDDVGDMGVKILLGETCTLPPIDTLITDPPKSGPSIVPEDKELHVTVLVLPTLLKYAESIRYGVKSREWGEGSRHDGLSYMVLNVKWVSGVSEQPTSKQKGIIPGVLSQEELDEEEGFARLFGGGPVGGGDGGVEESNVRAEVRVSRSGEIQNLGMGSWFKKQPRSKAEMEKPKERSVELLAEAAASLPALETGNKETEKGIVERVMERMIENANARDGRVRESVEEVKREDGEDFA
jgi:hypothetical protein